MNRNHNVLLASSMLLILAGSTQALAEERRCTGSLGAITLDNVLVPANATCTLTGTRIKGNIVVKSGGALVANRVVVIGSVQAEGAKSVTVRRSSRVGGSIQAVQGGAAVVANSSIDGSIQLESNRRMLRVLNNSVGADVQLFQNTGGAEVSDNRIDGNLQCKENVPKPTGSGNTVQGNREDQCAKL